MMPLGRFKQNNNHHQEKVLRVFGELGVKLTWLDSDNIKRHCLKNFTVLPDLNHRFLMRIYIYAVKIQVGYEYICEKYSSLKLTQVRQ